MTIMNNSNILKIGIWIVALAFAAGGFYLLVNFRLDVVEGNIKSIKEIRLPNLEGDLDYHDDRLYEQEKEVFGLKKEFGYLADKVDRNFKDQQNFQIEQRAVQKDILDGIKELHR